ncbi:RNA methyltransferase [Desulfovibrio inopinatus]|uniref:RNA methyltransferase n=1 Tax=Desulfovibrio inopinatus TaxID=102109 RepID=UPI000429391B|nr:RNA methyltransferase [Desulfovibrio inopinatus]
MLDDLAVVLFRPKFSENIGSAARAMANMGAKRLIVVSPLHYDENRARALATPKGIDILEQALFVDELAPALTDFQLVFGTTARTGGWRKGVITPEVAAPSVVETLTAGGSVAVVFGPEDQGLTNDETCICSQLLTIPTSDEASSLNLAQAVLVVLYECAKARRTRPFRPAGPPSSRLATHGERDTLFNTVRDTLLAIDFLHADNPEYWMLPFRRFVERVHLKRNEFNLLMGICRQVQWIAEKAGRNATTGGKKNQAD